MKATAILKGKPDAQGRQKLYIRLSDKQKRIHFVSDPPLWIHPDDFKKGKVLTSHPSHELLNKRIRQEMLKREAEVHGLFEKKEKPKDVPFKDYALDLFRRLERAREREASTIRYYMGQLDKFSRFAPTIYIGQIDDKILDKYKDHCYELGNETNGVWSSFKFLKLVLAQAKRDKVIKDTPFSSYKMPPYIAPKKEYLTAEQIERVNAFRTDEYTPEDLRFAATWFLIGCYTGLRYSDMHRFNREAHIIRGRLVIYTQKTGEPVSLPIHERVKEWLTAIDYRPLDITNEHYNRLLKLVAAGSKIKKNISGHCSRHTFAMKCADEEISIETTAKMLGHKSTKVTEVYYKVSGKRIDDEYKRLS